jgi:protein-arginine kinase activator protein McsA
MKKSKLCEDCGKKRSTTVRTISVGKRYRDRKHICDDCTTKTMQELTKAIEEAAG